MGLWGIMSNVYVFLTKNITLIRPVVTGLINNGLNNFLEKFNIKNYAEHVKGPY